MDSTTTQSTGTFRPVVPKRKALVRLRHRRPHGYTRARCTVRQERHKAGTAEVIT